MSTTTAPHVVFGTGAIGLATMEALRARGETVRMVNRTGHAPVPDDVEVVGGDASDPAFTTAAAAGARVVYQTLNPPYHQWEEQFPLLQAGVLAAAEAHGARMVSMENVYMYGRPNGDPSPRPARTRRTPTRDGSASRMSARAARRARGRPGRGGHRARVRLLRPARWRAVEPGRPGGAARARRAHGIRAR